MQACIASVGLAFITFLALALLLAAPARALMPPHLTGSMPEDGGVLVGDIVLLEGYTLYLPEPGQLVVTDLASGQEVPWETADLSCQDEGDWERAQTDDGAIQFRCELRIRLLAPEIGREYELRFLDRVIRFTCQPGD